MGRKLTSPMRRNGDLGRPPECRVAGGLPMSGVGVTLTAEGLPFGHQDERTLRRWCAPESLDAFKANRATLIGTA